MTVRLIESVEIGGTLFYYVQAANVTLNISMSFYILVIFSFQLIDSMLFNFNLIILILNMIIVRNTRFSEFCNGHAIKANFISNLIFLGLPEVPTLVDFDSAEGRKETSFLTTVFLMPLKVKKKRCPEMG